MRGALWLLLLAGVALRVAPLLDGTPVPHPDEFNATFWPLLVALGDPMPEVFYYPYFHTYLLALLQILRGLFVASADTTLNTWLSAQYFWHPEAAQLMARWVNACCGSVTLLLVGVRPKSCRLPLSRQTTGANSVDWERIDRCGHDEPVAPTGSLTIYWPASRSGIWRCRILPSSKVCDSDSSCCRSAPSQRKSSSDSGKGASSRLMPWSR